MSEKSVWTCVKTGMKGKWHHAMRHECMLNKGVSDVSYYHHGNGWIELKEVKKLPARPTTGVALGRWEDLSQRHFLIKRRGFLFMRINQPDRVYLLFNYKMLPPDVKPYWTWTDLATNSIGIWEYRMDFDELAELLRMDQ